MLISTTIEKVKTALTENRAQIIDSLKKHINANNDSELADFLGITRVGVTRARANKVPAAWVVAVSSAKKVSVNRLIWTDELEEDNDSPSLDMPKNPNTDILTQVIAGVESALKRKCAVLDPDKKAELVVLLYEHFINDKTIKQDTVERYLRLAS